MYGLKEGKRMYVGKKVTRVDAYDKADRTYAIHG